MGKKSRKKKAHQEQAAARPARKGRTPLLSGESAGSSDAPRLSVSPFGWLPLQLLLISLLGLLAYSNIFSVPLQWDDKEILLKNPAVQDLGYFFEQPKEKIPEMLSRDLQTRYVTYLSFALNYRYGKTDVRGWHVVNLAIHLANALLVYALVLLLCRTPKLARAALAQHAQTAAFFTAALFVSHPVQIEAVTYIYQRLASLVALFYLLSVVGYLGWRQATSRVGRYTLYGVSLLAAVLAMKTKENAFTLPVMLMMVEFLFYEGLLRKRTLSLLPFLATMLIIPLTLLSSSWSSAEGAAAIDSVTNRSGGISRWDYLVTQFRIIVLYMRLLFFPLNQNLDYMPPLIRSVFDPASFSSLLLILGVAGTGIVFAIKSRRGLPWLLLSAFGIFWFFIALSVESSVLPLSMIVDEYRIYLPSAGFLTAVVALLIFVRERFADSRLRIAVTAVLLIAPILFAVATFRRNIVWKSPITLWEDVSRKAPHNTRALTNLGKGYLDMQNYAEAEKVLRDALNEDPEYAKAANNLGYLYNVLGRPDEAIPLLKKAVTSADEAVEAHNNLANAYALKRMLDEAIMHYRQVIALNPWIPTPYNNLGATLMEKGLREEAISAYRQALAVSPDYADAHRNLANALLQKGNDEEARKHYEKALSLNPRHAETLANYALYHMKHQGLDRAVKLLSEAVRIRPQHEMAHFNLGRIYLQQREFDRARREFEIVLRINPGNAQAGQYLDAALRR